MMRFSIYSGLVLVGYSALDYGDPPMGVAFGQFEPADGYAAIQNQCSTNHHDQTVLDLSVQTEAGLVIPCAGLAILDYSEELAPPCIEVNISAFHIRSMASCFLSTSPCMSVNSANRNVPPMSASGCGLNRPLAVLHEGQLWVD